MKKTYREILMDNIFKYLFKILKKIYQRLTLKKEVVMKLNNRIMLQDLVSFFYKHRKSYNICNFKIFEFYDALWCYVNIMKIKSADDNTLPGYMKLMLPSRQDENILLLTNIYGPYCPECSAPLVLSRNRKYIICPYKHKKIKIKKLPLNPLDACIGIYRLQPDLTKQTIRKFKLSKSKK